MKLARSRHAPCILLAALCLLILSNVVYAQIPRAISYQGVLADANGNPKPDGDYAFTFRLYETSNGGTAIWSETKTLTLKRGLFSTALGDQTAFGVNVKFDKPYWLSIQVGNEAELPDRIALSASAYSLNSLKADVAATVAEGQVVKSINTLKDDVTLEGAGGATVTAAAGKITISAAGGNGTGIQGVQNTDNTLDITNPNGPTATINLKSPLVLQGSVGIGTTNPISRLTVQTGNADYGLTHTDGTHMLSTWIGKSVFTGVEGGWLGTRSNHPLHFFTNDGQPNITILPSGNVGIGSINPTTKFEVSGDATFLGNQYFGQGTRQMLNLFGVGFGIGVQTANLYYRSGAGFAWHAGGVHADGTYDSGGGTTLMTLDIFRGLDFGARLGPHLSLWTDSSGARRFGIGIQAETLYFRCGNSAGDGFAWHKGGGHSDGHRDPGGGIALMTMDEENGLVVNTKTTTKVLTITGGADIAEPFEISSGDVRKGSVVIIDEENPGQLKLSTQPYDTRVAGVVSGANGIHPAIALYQEGVMDGGENVALSGRVYVLADAGQAPIKPGDLLTTSSTLGHAMKATDRDRSHGAIIGKAMSALKEGKGLVLVLVNLQ